VKVKVDGGHQGKVEVGMDKLHDYLLPYLAEAYPQSIACGYPRKKILKFSNSDFGKEKKLPLHS
jgi:hypothetical protein